jgi:hypothetical protein
VNEEGHSKATQYPGRGTLGRGVQPGPGDARTVFDMLEGWVSGCVSVCRWIPRECGASFALILDETAGPPLWVGFCCQLSGLQSMGSWGWHPLEQKRSVD